MSGRDARGPGKSGAHNADRPHPLRGPGVASPFLPPMPQAPTLPTGVGYPHSGKEDHMPLFFLIAIGAGVLTLGATAIDPASDVRHQNTAQVQTTGYQAYASH